jgi:hypothetical protein
VLIPFVPVKGKNDVPPEEHDPSQVKNIIEGRKRGVKKIMGES